MIYKKITFILLLLIFAVSPACAEKIAVKIAPAQVISTHHDEIETGDWVKFEVAKDVYLNNVLYISKNTEIIGVVDFVHQNGWGGDCAQIYFKNFYTKDVNNKKVVISYPIEINGNSEMANAARDVSEDVFRKTWFFIHNIGYFKFGAFVLRGAEIFVEPDTKVYNLFIEQL